MRCHQQRSVAVENTIQFHYRHIVDRHFFEAVIMDEEIVLKLIELIKKNHVIWHLTDPKNKMVKPKAKVWKYIAKECGITVADAKKKWKGLKDSYFRRISRRKVLKSKRKPDNNYKYNMQMSFLKEYKSDKCPSIEYGEVETIKSESLPDNVLEDKLSVSTSCCSYDFTLGSSNSSDSFVCSDFSGDSPTAPAPKKHKKNAKKSPTCTEESAQDSFSQSYQTKAATAADRHSFKHSHQTRAATSAARDPFNQSHKTKGVIADNISSSLNIEDQLFCRSLVAKMMTFPLEKKNEAKIEMMKYLCLMEEDMKR